MKIIAREIIEPKQIELKRVAGGYADINKYVYINCYTFSGEFPFKENEEIEVQWGSEDEDGNTYGEVILKIDGNTVYTSEIIRGKYSCYKEKETLDLNYWKFIDAEKDLKIQFDLSKL